MFCHKCGAGAPGGSAFCGQCGAGAGAAVTYNAPGTRGAVDWGSAQEAWGKRPAGKPAKRGVFVALATAAVVLAACAAIIAFGGLDGRNTAGGVLGRDIEVMSYDNRDDVVETTNAARKAMLSDEVVAFN